MITYKNPISYYFSQGGCYSRPFLEPQLVRVGQQVLEHPEDRQRSLVLLCALTGEFSHHVPVVILRVLDDSHSLLCHPACQEVQQVQEHQEHQELQGRQPGRCFLALPKDTEKIEFSPLHIPGGVDLIFYF